MDNFIQLPFEKYKASEKSQLCLLTSEQVMENKRFTVKFSNFQAKYRMYKYGGFSTEEHVVPTCSYRMGTTDMGIGVAILGESNKFGYHCFHSNHCLDGCRHR